MLTWRLEQHDSSATRRLERRGSVLPTSRLISPIVSTASEPPAAVAFQTQPSCICGPSAPFLSDGPSPMLSLPTPPAPSITCRPPFPPPALVASVILLPCAFSAPVNPSATAELFEVRRLHELALSTSSAPASLRSLPLPLNPRKDERLALPCLKPLRNALGCCGQGMPPWLPRPPPTPLLPQPPPQPAVAPPLPRLRC